MLLFLRKTLFYSFTLTYLVLCPLLILYALGYIFRPGSEQGLLKAGLISVSTLPPGANVFVENKRFAEKTPTVVQGLLPGNYRLAVSLKGYRPWTGSVAVQAEKAVVFDKLLLLPQDDGDQTLSPEEFIDLIPVSGGRYFFLLRGQLLEDLFVYDIKEGVLSPAAEPGVLYAGMRLLSYFPGEENGRLLIHAQSGFWGEDRFLSVEPSPSARQFAEIPEPARQKPLSPIFAREGVTGFEPDPQMRRVLVWSDDRLGLLDLSGKETEGIRWLVKHSRKISQAFWVHDGSHALFRDGSAVYLLGLPENGQPLLQECFQVKRGSSIFYSEKLGRVFYLKKSGGQFCSMQLVPKHAF